MGLNSKLPKCPSPSDLSLGDDNIAELAGPLMIEGMKKVPVVGEGSACSQKGSETSES